MASSCVRAAVPPQTAALARSSLSLVWPLATQAATAPGRPDGPPALSSKPQRGRKRPTRKANAINFSSNVPRTPDDTMRTLLKSGRTDAAFKVFRNLGITSQLRIHQDTVTTLITKLGRWSRKREKNLKRFQPASMPAYPWITSKYEPPLQVPATPRSLADAENVLNGLRDNGYGRNAGMYEPIIKGYLRSGNLQAAVAVYADLVVDWSMAMTRSMPEGPEKGERMVSIARCKEMIAARREIVGNMRTDVTGDAEVPLPSQELLQLILARMEADLAKSSPLSNAPLAAIKSTPLFERSGQPLTTDRRPKGITPKESPKLFWALESGRILSALILHKVLPFRGYHEFSPLLHTLSMIPEAPRYTVEVILPPSQDYNPQEAPAWMQPRPVPHGWASVTSVPHTFRPSLYLFVRTLIRVMSGTSPATHQPLPIPEQVLQASATLEPSHPSEGTVAGP
ncbi:hypothetical protein FRB93_007487 [Tulasnella sp. JGI-2019a]|nr:hypothetical protein FRB93_007487 [Tulasnella sp. JGI-2019a]